MSKTLQRNLKAKIPKGLDGPEWDSSDEEGDEPVLAVKQTKTKKSTKSSKGKKVVKYDDGKDNNSSKDNDEEKDLVLYIGHLPRDFEELDLRRFVSQFGKVYNCRVARKIETGMPKGFAFIRFGDNETAKIVCETLHGYFLDKQRLVCQLRPSHPGMFFNTDEIINKRKKKIQLETQKRNSNLANSEKCKEITSRLVQREIKKRERLKALGIDFDFPGYKACQDDLEENAPEEKPDSPEDAMKEEKESGSPKKKRRKESMDSTHSESSSTKDKKKKKKRDSIDSIASTSSKPEDTETDGKLTGSAKKAKKAKSKKRRKSV